MRPRPSAAPVARLESPGELALVVPSLLGFTPAESLVVLSLHEPRGRLGLTQRLDLPPPGVSTRPMVEALAARVVADGGVGMLVVVFTEAPNRRGDLPHVDLVEQLAAAADRRELAVRDALLVRGGRWWSYTCADPDCCPNRGTALAASASSAGVSMVEAERALAGRAVLASREALAASIAPAHPLGLAAAVHALAEAANRQAAARAAQPEAARADAIACWRDALDVVADPRGVLPHEAKVELVVSLVDGRTRDAVLTEGTDRPDAMRRLVEQLCRVSAPPFDADVCTLLAWVSYLDGGGALTRIALERALADNPDHSEARLLDQCLESLMRPGELRAMLREAERAGVVDRRRRRRRH